MREVCLAPTGQPFVVSGSGTLAMEMAVANLIEEGDRALVVSTGYFSDRMAALLERHGAQVTRVEAMLGDAPGADALAQAMEGGDYKLVTVTHVDTSTGVRAPIQALLAEANRRGALTVVDGVCATGGETFHQEEWGADVYLTASQKAIGVPPGLALLMVSQRALNAWRARRTPVRSMYLDFAEWLPIHEAYEAGRAAYFATPPVNLIAALDVSLGQILAEGMEARFARHARMARAFRSAWQALALEMVPRTEALAANTLSALYLPGGVDSSLAQHIRAEGVVIAGGLHPEIKARSFRVGHMNAVNSADVLGAVGAIERALVRSGFRAEPGIGVVAAQRALTQAP
jgi:alanine-glyoxylate transaminase/serine-glyoxylate transaminase/serine-pyruvate transaminase